MKARTFVRNVHVPTQRKPMFHPGEELDLKGLLILDHHVDGLPAILRGKGVVDLGAGEE